jgi:hypothetical protein
MEVFTPELVAEFHWRGTLEHQGRLVGWISRIFPTNAFSDHAESSQF